MNVMIDLFGYANNLCPIESLITCNKIISFCREISDGRWPSNERQRKENAKTEDDIFQSTTAAIKPSIPEDAILSTARESGIGRLPRTDANTGTHSV